MTGGAGVGGSSACSSKQPWPNPQPTVQSHNLGDVPSKVEAIANVNCQYDFTWTQNTISSQTLHMHSSDSCLDVNNRMISSASQVNAVIIQAQSNELASNTCRPTANQISAVNLLLAPAPLNSINLIYSPWASYQVSDMHSTERCTFQELQCTVRNLASNLMKPAYVAPVGKAWQTIADSNCKLQVFIARVTSIFCIIYCL